MNSYLLDWANLLLRWTHVITAMAWIGASLYFVLLDGSLTPPEHDDLKKKGVDGEIWAVHGGGFYHSNKYMVAPRWRSLPENLHWSYWESYSTWLSGFGLFTVLYLFNAGTFMVDKAVYDWSPSAAVVAALAFFVVFWLVYDLICRSVAERKNGDVVVGVLVFGFVIAATWLACHLFAGRAAFLLVGAMLATAMSANVFFVIIPGQRKVIAQLRASKDPDPIHGQRGKQRSVHNTYFTLPVIIAMLSNHYGWLHEGRGNWIVLTVLMLAGALIRHSFAARHKAHVQGKRSPWEHAIGGVLMLVALVAWLAPSAAPSEARRDAAPVAEGYMAVRTVIDVRCVLCHNAQVRNKGVSLQTPELLKKHAQAVYQQAAVLKQMPLNNATQITDAERDVIKRWFEGGAPVN
jgi:uncharacterized membrane protein